MSNAQNLKIQKLREELQTKMPHVFRPVENLKKPQGFPTGCENLDQFLEGGGLPKGALSMLSGALGTGATSLWLESAAHAIRDKKWVAWVSPDVPLMPASLQQKGIHLGHFVVVESSRSRSIESSRSRTMANPSVERIAWLLQELMSSGLFDLIGCDLGEGQLRSKDLRKLQAQARATNIALVFLTRRPPPKGVTAALFALILKFERRQISIERALHRPTPQSFSRSVSYARFTHHTADRTEPGTTIKNPFSQCQSHSLPKTSEPLPSVDRRGKRS